MKHVHFIAIGGSGMSSLARILLAKGYRVSGSDVVASPLTDCLQKLGAIVHLGHHATHVGGADLVVVSSAIREDNEELVHSQDMGIPVIHRGELLAVLMRQRRGIAVAGAHGKTTTAAMISTVLDLAGYDPTVVVGGEITGMGSNARLGEGDYLVAEADESDGSFLKLDPHVAVVTNIDDDHLEYYGTMERLEQAFCQFVMGVPPDGFRVLCGDDPTLRRLFGLEAQRVHWYGFGEENHWQARDLKTKQWGLSFEVYREGARLGGVELQVVGRHNALNALASIAVAEGIGIGYEEAAHALAEFQGVVRRLQWMGEGGGVRVMDDYGHHPTEIRTTLQTLAQHVSGRIICVFQPHRYARTRRLYREFGRVFDRAWQVVLMDVFPGPGEHPEPHVNSGMIAESLRQNGKKVVWVRERSAVIDEAIRLAERGDVILTIGCGDVWRLCAPMVEKLSEEHDAPSVRSI